MIITEKRQVEKDVITDVICNYCGESMLLPVDKYGTFKNVCGLEEVVVRGNYASNALSDCTTYIFSLCESCIVKHLFDNFKIPVQLQDYM